MQALADAAGCSSSDLDRFHRLAQESARRSGSECTTAGWPELIGTPKQVGWAITVQQNRIDEFDDGPITKPHRSQMRAVLLRETRAKMWIDTRIEGRIHKQGDHERDAGTEVLGDTILVRAFRCGGECRAQLMNGLSNTRLLHRRGRSGWVPAFVRSSVGGTSATP